jgi:broad specificity phosphatase PhoE
MLSLLTLMLSGCGLLEPPTSAPSSAPAAVQWTFTVVRHAERADDGTDDPPLTEAGAARATRLGERLAASRGVAVYASTYRRAQSTAAPTATAWGVPVTSYEPQQPATDLTATIRNDHQRGAILIVGHSDTVPGIVGALCRCAVNPIDETQYGNLYTVEIGSDNTVRKVLQTLDY